MSRNQHKSRYLVFKHYNVHACWNSNTFSFHTKDIPSLPLNLFFTNSSLGSVTISWVAPLDTPLCVHSYTVTVRNSCNSSQVMVYNTTDNRSLLSITDLTSDGEYLVTVAGRDGAGRLGQESEELILSDPTQRVLFSYNAQQKSVIVEWKVSYKI